MIDQIIQDFEALRISAIKALQNHDEEYAIKCLSLGVSVIQNAKKHLPLGAAYRSLVNTHSNMFEGLIKLYLSRGQISPALEVLEATRTWSMAEDYSKLVQIRDTGRKLPTQLRQKMHKLQNFRTQLWKFTLASNRDTHASLIEEIYSAHDQLIDEICSQFPDYVRIARERPPLRGLQDLVNKGLKVVIYGVFTDFCLIAAASNTIDGILWWKLDFGEAEMWDQVWKYREVVSKWWLDIDEYVRLNKEISDVIIRPWFDTLGSGGPLCIIPHKSLHLLPFSALHIDGFMIEHFQILYAPALYTLLVEKDNFYLREKNLLAFCNPTTTNKADDLPNTEKEVKKIASKFQSSKIFNRQQATFENFVKEAPYFDTIHLACHAKFLSEYPLDSHLVLAKSKSGVSSLLAAKVLDIPLRASLVTLSACETAVGAITNCDEIVGLSLSFLRAGANAVLSSLWRANDKSTVLLMENFYNNVKKGFSYSEALCLAQMEMLRSQEFKHPYFWAAFVLTGFWRQNLQARHSSMVQSPSYL
jgi:CHAT domain-containing protein